MPQQRFAGMSETAIGPRPKALRALPNVVLTPHIFSGTIETHWSMAEIAPANLKARFVGKPLPAAVV
jgi:hydroxypyruvate reductase